MRLIPSCIAYLLVDFLFQILADLFTEFRLVQELRGDILVLLHAVDEQVLKGLPEHVTEPVERIDDGGLLQVRRGNSVFLYGIEEELVPGA